MAHHGVIALTAFEEHRLAPSMVGEQVAAGRLQDGQLFTYVRDGALAFEDSQGGVGLIQSTEAQLLNLGANTWLSMRNASTSGPAQYFQLWLQGTGLLRPARRIQRRFSVAGRRDVLLVLAAPRGRPGTLELHRQIHIVSGVLSAGRHVVYELESGRSAWLHVVAGQCQVGALTLQGGDGAAFTAERLVSLTATEPTEVLLVDLPVPLHHANGASHQRWEPKGALLAPRQLPGSSLRSSP